MKIGIDVGGSHVGIGIINKMGRIIAKEEKDVLDYQGSGEKLVEIIVNLIAKITDENGINISQVSLIGIAIPGTVSDTDIIKAENLKIKNFNIVSEINKYYNIPVFLRNDAKCAAIAEKEYGGLKKYDDAVFLVIGTGIGGAVFLEGNLLKPKKYEGFEIGHMVIEQNGKQCNCGRKGCFERYASMKFLKEEIEKEFNTGEINGIEARRILENSKNKEKSEKIINIYAHNLAIGLANLINIFEPETISIGGSFVYFSDLIIDKVINILKEENMLFNTDSMPKFIGAKLKNDAGIIGAVIEYKE